MTEILWGIIACGILTLVYAAFTIQSVMASDAGNAKMQEIAGAISEGASAYLNRQYSTIAMVGAVIFIAAWILLGHFVAIGFLMQISSSQTLSPQVLSAILRLWHSLLRSASLLRPPSLPRPVRVSWL